MFGEGFQGFFGDSGMELQRLAVQAQLQPILAAFNQAIAAKDTVAAASYAQSLAQAFEQIRLLMVSNAVCNGVVKLMNDIAVALTSTKMSERINALVAVNGWQQEHQANVILDAGAFKDLVLHQQA